MNFLEKLADGTRSLKVNVEEKGKFGYMPAWLLGVPIPLLVIAWLLFGR